MCKFILNNRYCKNYNFHNGFCHLHYQYSKENKRVRFNIKKNTIKYVSPYIHNLERLKSGKWKYQKNQKKLIFI